MKLILTKLYLILIMTMLPFVVFAATNNENSHTVTNWTQFQGNAQHNGYVPITLDPTLFNVKWKKTFDPTNIISLLNTATTANHIFITTTIPPYDTQGFNLFSVNIKKGNIDWKNSFPDAEFFGRNILTDSPTINLAADNNKVFLTYHSDIFSESKFSSYLVAYDDNSGVEIYNIPLSYAASAPVVDQNNVCIETTTTDFASKLACYAQDSGQLKWQSIRPSNTIPAGTNIPAIYNNKIVGSSHGDSINIYNLNDGALISNFTSKIDDYIPIIIDNSFQYILTTNIANNFTNITITNLEDPKIQNNQLGYFDFTTLASANNVLYSEGIMVGSNVLQATNEVDGKILWTVSIPQPSAFMACPIVTNNLIFVSYLTLDGSDITYAIDLKTHKIVWTFPSAVILALAQNTLFLVGDDNSLIAVGLN